MTDDLDCRWVKKIKEPSMDAPFLLVTLVFFAASVGLVYGCERLRTPS
jgi:hypothetical protein